MSSTGTLTVVMICSAFFSTHFCEARALCVCVCFFSFSNFLKIFFSLFSLREDAGSFFMEGWYVRYLLPYLFKLACMHLRTHLSSPFVPLAWVATCAPIFAIATQALYLAVQT